MVSSEHSVVINIKSKNWNLTPLFFYLRLWGASLVVASGCVNLGNLFNPVGDEMLVTRTKRWIASTAGEVSTLPGIVIPSMPATISKHCQTLKMIINYSPRDECETLRCWCSWSQWGIRMSPSRTTYHQVRSPTDWHHVLREKQGGQHDMLHRPDPTFVGWSSLLLMPKNSQMRAVEVPIGQWCLLGSWSNSSLLIPYLPVCQCRGRI